MSFALSKQEDRGPGRSAHSQGHSARVLVEQVVKPMVHLDRSLATMFDVLGLGGHLASAEEKLTRGDFLEALLWGLLIQTCLVVGENEIYIMFVSWSTS